MSDYKNLTPQKEMFSKKQENPKPTQYCIYGKSLKPGIPSDGGAVLPLGDSYIALFLISWNKIEC